MAHIERRNGKYRARYREPGGRERSQTFVTKRDADRFLIGIEHSKHVGGYVDPQAGKQRFGDYATAWQAMQVFRPTTAERFDINLARHIMPDLWGSSDRSCVAQ